MRPNISSQRRLDCAAIEDVKLNVECRDEIIPVLRKKGDGGNMSHFLLICSFFGIFSLLANSNYPVAAWSWIRLASDGAFGSRLKWRRK